MTKVNNISSARLGHNPGLIRLFHGKRTLGVYHSLPCSLLKASMRQVKQLQNEQANKMSTGPNEISCPSDERKRASLSAILTEATRKRFDIIQD